MNNPLKCCCCGAVSPDGVKPCGCATMCGFRDDEKGSVSFVTVEQSERVKLSQLIKARLMGIHPDDQDLVLENHDWARICAALEAGE